MTQEERIEREEALERERVLERDRLLGQEQVILGLVIREYRDRRRWDLERLGQKSGLSAGALGKIERGQASPTYRTLQRILLALGVAEADFVARKAEVAEEMLRRERHGNWREREASLLLPEAV